MKDGRTLSLVLLLGVCFARSKALALGESEREVLLETLIQMEEELKREPESLVEARDVNDDYSALRYHEVYSGDDERVGARALTQGEIEMIVDHHNKLRKGEGSSNMAKLRWNSKLAQMGQEWSARCQFEHGQPPYNPADLGGAKNIGQNIWASTDMKKTVADGVQAWFDEKSDFDYNTLGCRPGKMCGHYTQVTWGDTDEVGCGMTKCPSIMGMKNANFLVCNYLPAGNWAGKKPFLKGDSCNKCSNGHFFCDNGLCNTPCKSASANCQCKASCKNCGKISPDCRCNCVDGFSGVDCADECKDNHANCGGNPGWPAMWCDPGHQFVLDACPKLCKHCKAGSGGKPACRGDGEDKVGQLEELLEELRSEGESN